MYAFHEAMRIIDNYNESDYRDLSPVPKKSIGYAITEAPRGTLYHRYELDKDGLITKANIVPPTSQNQKTIEADLYQIVKDNMHLEEADLQHRCEQAIRNYDPCISCSTHFLKLKFNHEDANGN